MEKTQHEKDLYYLEVAKTVSTRSTCSRRQIGAVIVIDDQIVSTGFNDTPRDWPDCVDGGCPRAKSGATTGEDYEIYICCHAEENAIIQAARRGVKVKGSTIYTTLAPCVLCAKVIKNSGIVRVVYRETYEGFIKTWNFLDEVDIIVDNIPEETDDG